MPIKMEHLKPIIQKREILYIILIIALSAVVVSGFAQASRPQAALEAKKLYDIRTGGAEILKTEEVSGLYKVTLSFADDQGRAALQDVYVTKDAKYVLATGGMAVLEDLKKNLAAEKIYAQCLADAKVVIFGAGGDGNSLLQLQALGISSFSLKIFFDCSQNVQACQQAGVTAVPTMRIGAENHEGIQTPQFVEQQTGCRPGA